MDDTLSITTPENVELSYDLAGIGSRFIAVLIDHLIQIVIAVGVLLGVSILLSFLPAALGPTDDDYQARTAITGAVLAAVLLFLFALIWAYFILFEAFWNGQTPGKRLVRLRVIKENGYPIGLLDAIIRNLVRIIDFLPMSYSVGVVAMFLNRRCRRLGDLAAGTLVIKEHKPIGWRDLGVIAPRATPDDSRPVRMLVPGAEPPAPTDETALPPVEVRLPNLDRLTADEYTVIREFLQRRSAIGPWKSKELADRLAGAIARHLDYEIPRTVTSVQFLEQVLRESQGIRAA